MSWWRRLDPGRIAILAVLVLGVAAFLTRGQWLGTVETAVDVAVDAVDVAVDGEIDDEDLVTGGAVVAPAVVDIEDPEDFDVETERLYRIVPGAGSRASYHIEERLGGLSRTTVGTTTVLAGEIAVNLVDLAASRVGEIVVNVEVFQSDSALRDKRIRHDYLQSSHWPFVRFSPTSIEGLDTEFADGIAYDIAVTGELTVKETTRTETFAGKVTVTPDALVATMSTIVLTSHYDVGPINIARLAHTSDEVTLTFELVADRVEIGSEPTGDLRREIPIPEFAVGRFSGTVQPILETRCVSCHTTGGPAWTTLALDTAGDAAAIADDIAFVTGINFMPPWLPSDLSPEFVHDWSLGDNEIAAIKAWADAGGGLDVRPDTPLVARVQAILPVEEDQKIGPRDGLYTGYSRPDGWPVKADDYRCQVHEVADPEGDGNWVKGFEFRPDQVEVVHHAIVYRVPAEAAAEIAAKIAAEDEIEAVKGFSDEPGWTCFGLSGLRSQGVYSIQGWAPGQSPTIYPEGYGLYLWPGDMIVNQIHYHYDHDTPADGSWIILDTATAAEVAAGMTHIAGDDYLTPAEVPCTPAEATIAEERAATVDGYVNLCERSNVLAEIGEKYDDFAPLIPGLLLAQCGGTVDDYDDLDGTVGYSSCDLPARDTGTIHTVLGHMHEFGAAYRMTLHPDTPEERILLDIPVWDFEWQLNYEPVEKIRIERGDMVRFECWWDRTLQFMPEPRYITWNEGTVDEMCFSSIAVLPDV
ncbi:MAG: YceI family protein [Acidimicrobiaceae bacterium]|nr:YceI family protein [Acidimicrobiaceae bacterium]